jgi:hypothetical protein
MITFSPLGLHAPQVIIEQVNTLSTLILKIVTTLVYISAATNRFRQAVDIYHHLRLSLLVPRTLSDSCHVLVRSSFFTTTAYGSFGNAIKESRGVCVTFGCCICFSSSDSVERLRGMCAKFGRCIHFSSEKNALLNK